MFEKRPLPSYIRRHQQQRRNIPLTVLGCTAGLVLPFAALAVLVHYFPPTLPGTPAQEAQERLFQVPEVDCESEPECAFDLPEIPEGRRWQQIGPDTYILLRQDSNINPVYRRRP